MVLAQVGHYQRSQKNLHLVYYYRDLVIRLDSVLCKVFLTDLVILRFFALNPLYKTPKLLIGVQCDPQVLSKFMS